MAEERNVGVARAVAETAGDEDSTKAELQRRMEEARESITQTVTEIKDTVTNQYQSVKQSVTEALDWREQYRRRPVVWSVSALSVGFIVGYSLGSAFTDDDDDRRYTEDFEEDYDSATGVLANAAYPSYEAESRGRATRRSSSTPVASAAFAPQSLAGAASPSYGRGASPDTASSSASEADAAEPDKPSMLERFKETKAYDRLQEEVSSLGDRFINELSTVGQTVVLPMLFSKIKEMFGVDLSNKQQGQSSSGGGGGERTSAASGASAGGTTASTGARASSASAGSESGSSPSGGPSYGTSENRDYGTSR